MNEHDTQLVSGLLDGELKGFRLWLAKRHVDKCPVCAAEYRQQQRVREMLRANPPATAMSDSPEFFWSKVKADIQRQGDKRAEASMPALTFGDWIRQHQMAVATAMALVVAIVAVPWLVPSGTRKTVAVNTAAVSPGFARVEQIKTPIPQTAATSFDSEDAGVSVIWVTGLPWTHDMNEMKTEFANLDS